MYLSRDLVPEAVSSFSVPPTNTVFAFCNITNNAHQHNELHDTRLLSLTTGMPSRLKLDTYRGDGREMYCGKYPRKPNLK